MLHKYVTQALDKNLCISMRETATGYLTIKLKSR